MKRLTGRFMNSVLAHLERRRRERVLAHASGRLLDIGCGENRLVRAHGNGVGVDVFDWGGVDLVVTDTSKLPFPDRSFDTVSFVACLNHIPNRDAVLIEARRLLKDNGRLIVTMIPPTLSDVWHKIIYPWDADQSERGMKAGEVYGFTSAEIREILGRAGFEIVTHKRFVFWLNNLYVAAKREGAGGSG